MASALRRIAPTTLAVVLILILAACGGSSRSKRTTTIIGNTSTSNPTPSVTSITPTSATVGGTAFTLTVDGTGFVSGSTIQWNGTARTTNFVNSTQLTAAIPAADVANAGTAQVTVTSPAPGGGASNAVTFTANNPAPNVNSISPSSGMVGSGSFALTVTGANFVSSSVIKWNGNNLTTAFVSATQLTATVPSTGMATAGTIPVSVTTPGPGGGTASVNFIANNPAPAISSLSPSNATAGDPAFTLTVNGTSFVNGSVIQWNGTNLTTTYVSATQLSAAVSAANIASQGSPQVKVFNPAPGGGLSSGFAFAVNAPAQTVGVIGIVSLRDSGGISNNWSTYSVTAGGGRYVAFASHATNLTASADTNSSPDVFLRDTCIGAPAGCTPSTILISATPGGEAGNDEAEPGSVSPDGRYVAFWSASTNLVAGVTTGSNVYVRDTCIGAGGSCSPSTTLVSHGIDGESANSSTFWPSMTANGRYVAFYSAATNLMAGDSNSDPDVFLRDTCIGAVGACTPSTRIVDVNPIGGQSTASGVETIYITPDGRYVGFSTFANDLGPPDTNALPDVYLHDTCIGAQGPCTESNLRVSLSNIGQEPNGWTGINGNGGSTLPWMTPDARYILFGTQATNMGGSDINGQPDIFLRDTCLGADLCSTSTTLISVASDGGYANSYSLLSSISHDGRYVAFTSSSTNLLPGGNIGNQVFVRDTCNGAPEGCTPKTVMVSVNSNGTPANQFCSQGVISGDGKYVFFRSGATNLYAGDTNSSDDIFIARTGF